MPRSPLPHRLTFEDAMSVHVLRAQGVIFSELTRLFGVNPARFYEILSGKLYPGSWDAAAERLAGNEIWHPEITLAIQRLGFTPVLLALQAANPNKKVFEQELKRLRKSAAFQGCATSRRPLARYR